MTVLRVATHDMHGSTGTHETARRLRSVRTDVVCVQDAPRRLRWRSRCAALAREAGLVYVTGGGTCAGAMLLGSHRAFVSYREDFILPRQPRRPARGVAIAVFTFAGERRLVVASAGLGGNTDERPRLVDVAMGRLESFARHYGAPYVLGDVDGIVASDDIEIVDAHAIDGAVDGAQGAGDRSTGARLPAVVQLRLPERPR